MSVCIRKLNYIYDERSPFAVAAIENVDIDINDGEYVCIIGHTGSGKSTLVQHLNGILKPSSVEKMIVEGVDLTVKKPDYIALRRCVGMVFQYPEYQLFEQTVFDDIAFGPKNMGFSEEKVNGAVRESMALVGLDEKTAQLSPFELSGGQRRRAAIAGVLAMQPSLLVLDEPIAGLDPIGKREILGVIDEYKKRYGATVVMISHNMDDIVEVADKVIVMNRGKKMLDGTPNEVFGKHELLAELGLGLPTVSRIVCDLNRQGKHIPTDICRIDELAKYISEVNG